MKLEVGMYAKTNDGCICQIKKETYSKYLYKNREICYEVDKPINTNFELYIDDIKKASHNIIDLIEVGDYINGCYVSNKRASVNEHLGGHPKGIGIIKCNAYFNQGNYDDCKFEWIEEKDIKSIVTKEQFESIKYSLEG